MPEVSGRAIAVAIQAVHKEMRELRAYIASGDEEGRIQPVDATHSLNISAGV